jgi:hypothetical protein
MTLEAKKLLSATIRVARLGYAAGTTLHDPL